MISGQVKPTWCASWASADTWESPTEMSEPLLSTWFKFFPVGELGPLQTRQHSHLSISLILWLFLSSTKWIEALTIGHRFITSKIKLFSFPEREKQKAIYLKDNLYHHNSVIKINIVKDFRTIMLNSLIFMKDCNCQHFYSFTYFSNFRNFSLCHQYMLPLLYCLK